MKYSTLSFGIVGVAIIAMSLGPWSGGCSGKDEGKETRMATPFHGGGTLFPINRLGLRIVGPLEHRFEGGDVWLRHFTVKDATGSEFPWESDLTDGKMGKAVSIQINAEGSTGPVCATGSLTCKGLRYSITAEWREQEGGQPGDWHLVQCKIVRAERE